jgi:HSP20 family protein
MRGEVNMALDENFDRWLRRMRAQGRMPFFGFQGFEDMDKMFNEMFKEITESIPKELIRERKLPGGGKIREMGPFVYGYSITIGPDGKPVIREFGNVKPSTKITPSGYRKPSLQYREGREPLVDVIEDDGTIRVVAEVPGIEKKEIDLTCTENTLIVSVDTERRKYYKEVDLPGEVDPKVGKASFKNGVLEVTLTKIKKKRPTGEKIRLD